MKVSEVNYKKGETEERDPREWKKCGGVSEGKNNSTNGCTSDFEIKTREIEDREQFHSKSNRSQKIK
jgi:hypothetical protein